MVLDDIPHKVDQAVVQKIRVYVVIPTSTRCQYRRESNRIGWHTSLKGVWLLVKKTGHAWQFLHWRSSQ